MHIKYMFFIDRKSHIIFLHQSTPLLLITILYQNTIKNQIIIATSKQITIMQNKHTKIQ